MRGCTSTTTNVGYIKGIGDVVPWERFRLAISEPAEPAEPTEEPTTTRRVGKEGKEGKTSFAAHRYPVGVWLAGETVEVSVVNGLVSIHHRDVLVATHAQRHQPAEETKALTRKVKQKRPRPRQPTVGQSVDPQGRLVGNVSFAGQVWIGGDSRCDRRVVGRQHQRLSETHEWNRQLAAPTRRPESDDRITDDIGSMLETLDRALRTG